MCFSTLSLQSQICPDCDNLPEATIYPRFWEDPTGIVYQVESIDHPDKLGIWILYEDLGSNQKRVLHTNHVRCLENLDGSQVDGRSKLEITNKDIQVFPNPTSGVVMVDLDDHSGTSTITIYKINGSFVYSTRLKGPGAHPVSLLDFEEGTYILQVESKSQITRKTIIRE